MPRLPDSPLTPMTAPGLAAPLRLLDGAGWHVSKELAVPANLTLIHLPPYSPELNPVENIWQFMRDNWLSNRIFTSYDNIVAHCCEAWNRLIEQPWKIIFAVAVLVALSAMTYGQVAAILVEMFPARIRYTSMSVPYHIGIGWVGGFMPMTAFAIATATGDVFAGLWYPIVFGVIGIVSCLFLFPETKGRVLV